MAEVPGAPCCLRRAVCSVNSDYNVGDGPAEREPERRIDGNEHLPGSLCVQTLPSGSSGTPEKVALTEAPGSKSACRLFLAKLRLAARRQMVVKITIVYHCPFESETSSYGGQ